MRRVALGLTVSVVSVVVLGGCGGGGTPSTSHESTTPTSAAENLAGVPPCVSSQLQATAVSDGSIGPATAVIELSNSGNERCFLQGYLGLSLPDQGARPLHLDVVHQGVVASNGFRGGHTSSHPQAVVLRPGQPDAAWIATQWHNWCGSSAGSLDLTLILRNGGDVPIAQQGSVQGLKCINPNDQSLLDEGPVQTPVR